MRKKTSKLRLLEKNRFSVFFDSFSMCCNCGSLRNNTKHEVFSGRNRRNSMKYGFVIPLCLSCHQILQDDSAFNNKWKIRSQEYFEEHYGTHEDFIKIFRMNYKD